MPTTAHGRITLEAAWRQITHEEMTGEQLQKAIALALVSIALSLRKVAGAMGGTVTVRH